MSLIYMDGFDMGDFIGRGWTGGDASLSATTRFSYGQSLYTTAPAATYKRLPVAMSSIIFGVAIHYTMQDYGASSRDILLQSDNGTVNHLNFKWINSTTYALQLNAVTIATASVPFNLNTWYYLEVAATIADAGGTCEVRMNGKTIINYTGDTRNGGTVGAIDTFVISHGSSGVRGHIDDLYICDPTGSAPYNTFLGEVRLYALPPSGAGSSTQFTPSSGANYTAVDELPYSATDYVSSGTTGHRDMYAMSDLPASVASVLAVQNTVIARKTDATNISLKSIIKSGATTQDGPTAILPGFDTSIIDLRVTDPDTSVSWTISGVNALEAGFEVV